MKNAVRICENGDVVLNLASFSTFYFTVDFEYNGYLFSIKGMSDILLSELFAALGIEENGIKVIS